MKEQKIRLCLCVLLIAVYLHSIQGAKKGIRIDRLEACGKSNNSPFKWDDVQIYHLPNGLCGIYSSGEILRDVPTFYLSVEVKRCSSKEALDMCEYITQLRQINTCKIMAIKGVGWSSYVDAFEPKLRCPFKKGKYVSKNGTLDPNLALLIPLEDWYWKFKIRVMYDNEYMDVCLEFQTFVIR
ncbi:hypothetical protein CBL_04876 [Carabus blaptoides fortunei]